MSGMMDWKDIIRTSIRARSARYWYKDGVEDAAIAAAEACRHCHVEEIIDAVELEIKKHEFICNFDDPCDAWAA